MFGKQRESLGRDLQDQQQTVSIDQYRPAGIKPLANFEGPTIINGSVIGQDLTILGENLNIISREALQIDGEIRGNISGKRVNIGASGVVNGTICAEAVQIDGLVSGAVRAVAITLNASAKVTGELLHRVLVVSEGAEFEGTVRRSTSDAELKPDFTALRGPASDASAIQPMIATPRENADSAPITARFGADE